MLGVAFAILGHWVGGHRYIGFGGHRYTGLEAIAILGLEAIAILGFDAIAKYRLQAIAILGWRPFCIDHMVCHFVCFAVQVLEALSAGAMSFPGRVSGVEKAAPKL